jgi:tyrosine-protein kinase Yes
VILPLTNIFVYVSAISRDDASLKGSQSTLKGSQNPLKGSQNLLARSQSVLRHSQIPFNELIIEKEIGMGSYGRVCLGRWNHGPVALKFCRKKENIDDFAQEVRVMIELPPHPNVVQMFGISVDGPEAVIILEYCDGGSLDKVLFDSQQQIAPEKKIDLAFGIASGMLHLHRYNIVHRDLAARNILLTGSGQPKISDFGMSRILDSAEEGKTKSNIGPVCWMAPESIAKRNYSKKSDVWTFGIVVYEIVAQCEPHKDADIIQVAAEIRDKGLTPKIPNGCPPLLRQLMKICWRKDPNKRPTFDEICALFQSHFESIKLAEN